MRWIKRGHEPAALGAIRKTYTPRWIQYYHNRVGSEPHDTHWLTFRAELSKYFHDLCVYCQRRMKGEVDHFRPKSRFPSLVYDWSNWLFSCHDCNHSKGGKWPAMGYIDPCKRAREHRPERYFTFDTETGEILPKDDLSGHRRRKAQRMIDDLDLNNIQHLKSRLEWLDLASGAFPSAPNQLNPTQQRQVAHYSSSAAPLSSITRVWLCKRGYPLPG